MPEIVQKHESQSWNLKIHFSESVWDFLMTIA